VRASHNETYFVTINRYGKGVANLQERRAQSCFKRTGGTFQCMKPKHARPLKDRFCNFVRLKNHQCCSIISEDFECTIAKEYWEGRLRCFQVVVLVIVGCHHIGQHEVVHDRRTIVRKLPARLPLRQHHQEVHPDGQAVVVEVIHSGEDRVEQVKAFQERQHLHRIFLIAENTNVVPRSRP